MHSTGEPIFMQFQWLCISEKFFMVIQFFIQEVSLQHFCHYTETISVWFCYDTSKVRLRQRQKLLRLTWDKTTSQSKQTATTQRAPLRLPSPALSHLCLLWPAADSDNLLDELLLLQLYGFLHGDLTEGVHRVLHPICHHVRVVWLHANLRIEEYSRTMTLLGWQINILDSQDIRANFRYWQAASV